MLQLLYQMETFSQWLEDQLRIRGLKPADLSRASGVSNATISRILNSTRQAGPDACKAIARALNISQEEVFRQRGFLDPLPPGVSDNHITPEEREHIRLLRALNPGHREAALLMLRGLAQSEPQPHYYTYTPVESRPASATCVVENILALAADSEKREAISKLLATAPEESQQKTMQRVLDFLEIIIAESRKQVVEAEAGGQTTP